MNVYNMSDGPFSSLFVGQKKVQYDCPLRTWQVGNIYAINNSW